MSQSNPTPDLFSEPMVHFGVSSVWDAEFFRTCKQAASAEARTYDALATRFPGRPGVAPAERGEGHQGREVL